MRTWPLWLTTTLGICLMVVLATPSLAGEETDETKTTSAVVVVKTQADGSTKTVRVVRMKDGKWVAEGEDVEVDVDVKTEPKMPGVTIRTEDGRVQPLIIHEKDGRVLLLGGDAMKRARLVPFQPGMTPPGGVQPKLWLADAARKGALGKSRLGPLHTVLRYMMEKHSGQKVAGCPMEAWFQGESVPMQGLRDAFVEDGWTAAKLKAWMVGHKPQPPRTAMMFGQMGEGHAAHPHMFGAGMHQGMHPGMWTAPVQTRTIIMWHDGTQWRRHEMPAQGPVHQAPWMYGMPFGSHPHMFGGGMHGAGGYGHMPLPRQGAWPAHPGMGKGKMRGRCSDGACSCPECPSRARKPMARGLGLPGDMPEAARQALILALGGEIAEDVDEDEGDEASALMARLLPSILLEESVTRSKCDDCPNKGSCGGCADKADCGSDCKGEGEKKANPECDCPCNGACGGDCENCPMKKKADAEKAAKKDCCGSCGGAETPAK